MTTASGRKPSWTAFIIGWVLSLLPIVMMGFGGAYALVKPDMMIGRLKDVGFPADFGRILWGLELLCTLLYAIPYTSVLGAILLTGYLGGAIACHVRLGQTDWMVAVGFGIVVWLGLWLREPRLRAILPLRA